MSTKSLNRLKKLLSILRDEERSLSMKHLSAYDTHGSGHKTKMKYLCKVIQNHPEIEYEKLKQIVSPQTSKASFDQLIKRTADRVRESLILDVNILRPGNYSKVFQKKYLMRKKILESRIIGGRGLNNESISLLEKLIKEAKTYELYDELLELLRLKQDKIVNIKGLNAYFKIGEEIEHYEKVRGYFMQARDAINIYQAKVNFSSESKGDPKLLKETMLSLEKAASLSSSANVQSLSYLTALDYYELVRDYQKSYEVGIKFLQLIRGSVTVRSDKREVYVLENLISNEVCRLEFGNAKSLISESLELMPNRKILLMYNVIESQMFVNFYEQQYDLVLSDFQKMEEFPTAKRDIFSTKLFYYKAMRYFALEEYRQANLLLSNLPSLEKDKEGWNVWLRIMRILSSIELLKLELIDYDIASFRKYMQRIRKKYELNERTELILKILLSLDRNNYDFKLVAKEQVNELALLASPTSEFRWIPKSPEMILFHLWFDAKVKDVRYKIDLSRYLENRKSL